MNYGMIVIKAIKHYVRVCESRDPLNVYLKQSIITLIICDMPDIVYTSIKIHSIKYLLRNQTQFYNTIIETLIQLKKTVLP